MIASRARALSLAVATALVLAASASSANTSAPPVARPSPAGLAAQVDQVARQLQSAEENLRFVETQFTQRPEFNDEEAKLRRFSNGEIQYLLGDWASASVLFYDLVSDPKFRTSPSYPDALFYLSDSLFQQQNYIGARLYLRELLTLPPTGRYKDVISRYLAVASRLNQFDDIDRYIEQARQLSGGKLPPELAYVYAKSIFKRTDLPDAERIARARAAFEPLTHTQVGILRHQSAYFLGVLSVQAGEFPAAIEQFRALTTLTTDNAEVARIRELAFLSLGRLLYETGRYDEAIDQYQEIQRHSESFVDSLYEIAWAYVKKGDFPRAKNAIDILLLVDPESPLAPDAQILQGHLLLKMQRYSEATQTYRGVIDAYAPIRNQLGTLLTSHRDPIAYFDSLLSRKDQALELSMLLPPLALRYANTQQEVAGAVQLVSNLDSGRQGMQDAQGLATRILQALDERALETFPVLQEGYTRVDAVESALARAEQLLVQVESTVVLEQLSPEERQQLDALHLERRALEPRFSTLPTDQKEVEERRQRLRARVDEVDREAFRIGYELQSLRAAATAMRKWIEDTRPQRDTDPADEKAFSLKLQEEVDTLETLRQELERSRARLGDERHAVDVSIAGEALIRRQYTEVLRREHALVSVAEGRVPADAAQVIARAHSVRERMGRLLDRATTAKHVLRVQLERRGHLIRAKVRDEQRLLQEYGQEIARVSGDARHLVGRIAYDSFRRVHQQFYDLILKADVGMVDVAFKRKQDRTTQIQELSSQKDHELRTFDGEFKEILEDAK